MTYTNLEIFLSILAVGLLMIIYHMSPSKEEMNGSDNPYETGELLNEKMEMYNWFTSGNPSHQIKTPAEILLD